MIICDDHPVCVSGLELFLKQAFKEDLACRHAHSGAQLRRLMCEKKPNLVFLDLQLPDISGLELIQQVQELSADLPIFVVTACEDTGILSKVKESGVVALLSKMHSTEVLHQALQAALGEERFFMDPEIAQLLSKSKAEGLTPREWEVLELISRGMRNEDIARSLGCSIETVKTHRSKLGQKTATRNRAELTAWYLQRKR